MSETLNARNIHTLAASAKSDREKREVLEKRITDLEVMVRMQASQLGALQELFFKTLGKNGIGPTAR